MGFSHYHGTADVNEEVKPIFVCKEAIPDSQNFGKSEFLR